MLIPGRWHEPVRRGEVDLLFRRWRRPMAVAGSVHRTAAGRLAVLDVREVDPAAVDDADAARAGYPSAAALVGDLRGREGDPVYRVQVRPVEEPDPREALADDDALGPRELEALERRLARMDRGDAGAWTDAVLRLVRRRPGVRAGDLAEELGREVLPFKRDVRRLKELGLTRSLAVGYELSPRGRRLLELRDAGPGTREEA